jgi:glycosyltransferase involved in cell wall biosynthesis
MKIAIFTPTFLPKCSGAEIFHHNLASQFVKMGHQPSVILPKSLHRRLVSEDWNLPYPTIPYPANFWSYFKRSAALAFWLNRLALDRLQRLHRFDVWHTVVLSPSGVCFADWQSRRKVPGLIRAVGDDVKAVAGAETPPHMLSLIKKQIPRAQRVVSLSRDMSVDLERLGVPADRIEIIPNAVDHARFSAPVDKAALRQAHGISPEAFVFLCVARNHPQKDLPTLLRAFQKAREGALGKNLHLVIAGRGVPELRDETLAMGLAESITLLEIQPSPGPKGPPEYPPQALVELYRVADAFVLSSLLEGFSTALLEAKAAGLPIVATRVPGIVDQVEDGVDGMLVSSKNPDRLSEAILRISSDTGLAARIAEQAGIRSLKFRWESIAQDYIRHYLQTIASAREASMSCVSNK